MKTLLYYLVMGVFIITLISLTSCNFKKKGIVVSYDDFKDDFEWSFSNPPCVFDVPDEWKLCGISPNNRWGRTSWDWGCPYYPSLVSTSSGYLILQVPGNFQNKGAHIETIRKDYWYGSYRAKIRAGMHSGTNDQGSCNGFFYYLWDRREIDVEIKTQEHESYLVHFTNQSGSSSEYTLFADPTSIYIEYGFDWYVNRIDFFVNGVKVICQDSTQTDTIPNKPGQIILNHWTDNTGWAGDPPQLVSNMSVDYVRHVPFILVKDEKTKKTFLRKGNSLTIFWESFGDTTSYPVKIELWKNGQFYKQIQNSVPNTGSYIWSISPKLLSGRNYQIKILSDLNANYFDFSNNVFTIL